jgi:tetratricopeptide (TPR) repeat protein
MKLSCKIISDLLPLYVEDLASEDSRKAVEEHIATCSACRKNLEDMRKQEDSITIEDIPLKKVKATLQKQRLKAIALTAVLVLALAVSIIAFLTTPEYLPYSDNMFTFSENEDGTIIVTVNKAISGYDVDEYFDPDNTSVYIYNISVWKYQFGKRSVGQNIVLKPANAENAAVFYHTDGAEDTFVYGYNPDPDRGIITLPRLVLDYYIFIAIMLIMILGVLLLSFRKDTKAKRVLEYIIGIPAAYLIGHLCIKGFTTTTYSVTRDLFAIMTVAVLLYCALEINQGEAYFIFKNIYGGDWADFLDKSSDLSDEKVAKVVAMLRFYALFEQGNYEEALDIYEKQLAIDKDNQKAKVLAAICLLETGEKKKAAKLAEELGKSDPNSWIMADLALYYLKAGDQEKALQLAEKSLDSDLTNLDAVAVLSELAKSGIELQCNLAIIKFVVYSTEPIRLAEQELKAMSLDIPLEYQLPSSPWKLSDRSKDIPEQDESDDTSGDKGDTPVVVDQQKNKAVEAQDPDTIEAVFAAVQSYLDKYYGLSVVNGDIYDPSYNGYAIRIHEISDLKGNRAVGLLGPYASEADYEIGVHKRGGRWQVDYCCSYYMGVDCDSDKSENYEEICSLIAKKEGFEIKDDAWVYRFDLKSYDSGRAVVLAAPFCEHWKWVYTLEKGSSGWQVVSREPASEPRFPEWLYGHARR